MWKASGVIGEGSDSFPIVEEIEAKKRGIRCAVYSKPLKLTASLLQAAIDAVIEMKTKKSSSFAF